MAYFCFKIIVNNSYLTTFERSLRVRHFIDDNCRNYRPLVARSVGERNVVETSCWCCWLNCPHYRSRELIRAEFVDIVFYLIFTLQVAQGASRCLVIYLRSFPLPLAEDKRKIAWFFTSPQTKTAWRYLVRRFLIFSLIYRPQADLPSTA